MKPTFYAAAIIALSSAAFLPAQSMAQVGVSVVIGNAPPPPRVEAVPQARRGYVWAPGYWNWDGRRHVWLGGHWEPERAGYVYQRPEWVREDGGWRMNNGGWVEVQQPAAVDYVTVAPPPPRYERVPAPRAGFFWASGHWEWRGRRHEWVPGVWVAERPGFVYSPAVWVQRDGRWIMEGGRWAPRGGPGHRDGDDHRDGRYDRHDDHHDDHDHRDRDRDGVPDREDSHPDNPRRD